MSGHRKRPRDFSQAAKLVIDIATGEVEDRPHPTETGQESNGALIRAAESWSGLRFTEFELR